MTDLSREEFSSYNYSKYFDLAPVGYMTLDAAGTIVSTNSQIAAMLNANVEELVSSSFINFVSLEDQDKFLQFLTQLSDSGERAICEVDIPLDNVENIVLELHGIAVFDANGNQKGYYLGLMDITRTKRLELQLVQSQRLEALGVLASGVAHDFNNILGAILGFSELTLYELPKDNRQRSYIEQIQKAGLRGKNLVEQIFAYSRRVSMDQKPVPLQVVLAEAVKMLRASIPANVEIRTNFSMECESVMANITQIHQIVINLCTNAFHAIHPGPGIIELILEPLNNDLVDEQVELMPKPEYFIRLKIKDNGKGMDDDTLRQIFNPFFTTKPADLGTGLGLSIVQNIVKSHYGQMSIYSTPGVGTEFNIYFPVTDVDSADEVDEIEDMERGDESILLVDDEQSLVMVGRKLLEHLGYKVTAVNESSQALELFKENPFGFDLVITDQTMPELTGVELAQQITSIRVGTPIILLTGYRNSETVSDARAAGVSEILTKPIDIRVFSQKIRRVLGNT